MSIYSLMTSALIPCPSWFVNRGEIKVDEWMGVLLEGKTCFWLYVQEWQSCIICILFFVLRFSIVFSAVVVPGVHPKQQWITILSSLHLCQHLMSLKKKKVSFFLKKCFYLYEFCLLICMCTTCMSSVLEIIKGLWIPWNLELHMVRSYHVGIGIWT